MWRMFTEYWCLLAYLLHLATYAKFPSKRLLFYLINKRSKSAEAFIIDLEASVKDNFA